MSLVSSFARTVAAVGGIWSLVLVVAVVVWAKHTQSITWRRAFEALWKGLPEKKTGVVAFNRSGRIPFNIAAPTVPERVTRIKPEVAVAAIALIEAARGAATDSAARLVSLSNVVEHAVP